MEELESSQAITWKLWGLGCGLLYFNWKPSPPLVKEKYQSVGMGHKACLRAVAKRNVMSSHLTFLRPHLYRLFLFLFLLYLQFLNSLLQGPTWGPLLISSTWEEFASVTSPSSLVLLLFLLLSGLELSSIWTLSQTLNSKHICSIFGLP